MTEQPTPEQPAAARPATAPAATAQPDQAATSVAASDRLRQGTRALLGRAGDAARRAGRDLWHTIATGPDEPPPVLRRLRPVSAPTVVALLLVAVPLGWFVLAVGEEARRWIASPWWTLVSLLTVLLLGVAVRWPLLAWRVAYLALLYDLVLAHWEPNGYPVFPPLFVSELQLLAFGIVLLLVAAGQPFRVVRWVWTLTIALVWLAPLNWGFTLWGAVHRLVPLAVENPLTPVGVPGLRLTGPPQLQAAQVVAIAAVTAAVAIGQLSRYRTRTRKQLAVAEEQGLVLAERARIARELHDVVAHHMSMVAVRAETAPYRLKGVAPAARAEFEEISKESRTGLAEMRRLLGVLRSGDAPAPTTPQPGLADLADLVESARAAGGSITVEMHGSMTGLPATVDLCAYRIIQEALTNAAQHAAGAPVRVVLRRTPSVLELSVGNGPGQRVADRRTAPSAITGHGLRGMRERVMMLNGSLYAGVADDGGFEVSATLPLGGDRS